MKTRDAFAFRELYQNLSTPLYDNGEFWGYVPNGDLRCFFGDDYEYAPQSFIDMKAKLNEMIGDVKNLKRDKKKLDRHQRRLQRYADIFLSSRDGNKLERTKILVEKYSLIYDAFDDLIAQLTQIYKKDMVTLEKIYRCDTGKRLRRARCRKGYTQEQVAGFLGITSVGYGSYERGDRDMSTLMLYRIAKILDISADEILGIDKK